MRWFVALWLALLSIGASAQPRPHTQVSLLLSDSTAKPGSTVTAAVLLKMEPEWHTYWKNPGDLGKATKIKWDLPEGITAGEIQWPAPEKRTDIAADLTTVTYVYNDQAALIIPLTIGENAKAGALQIKAKVDWLECRTECVLQTVRLSVDLKIGPNAEPSPDAAKIQEWQAKIPKPASDIELSAKWDGPESAEERPLVFSVNKSSGAWDFYNYPSDDFELLGKTTPLPAADGKIFFRKAAKKTGDKWPTEMMGLIIADNNPTSAPVVKVSISGAGPATSASVAGTTSSSANGPTKSLGLMLGLAFIGGLILNIMPCVLPVIALKILGFVRQSNENPAQVRTLGLIYALGVITSFLGLAAFVIVIKQAGKAASWGMQFQDPKFLVFITVLVTLVAMNLFGVFEITLSGRALDAAGGLASKEGKSGAFFNGVLATILATPCTAPFLGAALGFAFASSAAVIIAVFLMVALGLASPYVILCWFPAWLKKLPKPGAWMEKFKIAMGFPMLATAIWLFSLASAHFGKSGALTLGLSLVMLGFAAWIFGEFVQRGTKRRGLAGVLATILVALSIFYFTANVRAKTEEWAAWTPAAVEAARAKGQPVLVDFTADWCLTCQLNKKTSLDVISVREKLKSLNVATFIGDNTAESPQIAAELAKYQRAGVPLVLVFPADPKAAPIVLPEVLTPNLVLEALEKAAARKAVATVDQMAPKR